MTLDELRKEIDRIDEEILVRLEERFGIVVKIGAQKKKLGFQLVNSAREARKLEIIENKSTAEFTEYNLDIFEAIMDTSKELQQRIIDGEVFSGDEV